MVSNFKLLATLFILNFATSLYAKKEVQPANDNEAKKTEVSSSPPALSTESYFTVNTYKFTKQNVFNKGEDENEITENDDDRIWIIRDDNIDEILNNTSNIGTDVINNYELTNPEGETKKAPKLADTRKKTNKKLSKSKDNRNNFTKTLTTVEPDENDIEENGHENPTKSEIHAYNSVKKQESQVSITFSNDGDKKSNDIISYKNNNYSSDGIIIQRLVNILLGKMAGSIGNTAPKMLAVLKKQQMLGESPVSTISDSKSTDLNTLSNNTDELNRNPKKPIEPEGEVNEETKKTSDTIQTITPIEKIQAPSDSTLTETKIIQNSFGSDLTQPRNLLTIINSGIIENMQAIVPLEGHNLIFNDKIITPGIHFVTANVTSEEYMASVADMISTLSFERKADLKILGKKAKKKIVQALIKSIEEGMILIINSGSINGLSLRLPGTDTPKSGKSTTEIPTTEIATDDDVKITTENPADETNTYNPNMEIITKKTSTSVTDASLDTDATSEYLYIDNITSSENYSKITITNSETEPTTQSTNLKITNQTRNTNVASTELNIERTTIHQNPKDAFTKNETILLKGETTNDIRNNKSKSPNSINITNGHSVRHEVSTGDFGSNSIKSRDKITNDISTYPSTKSNTEITSDNVQKYTEQELFNSVPRIENVIQNQVSEIVTKHIESGRRKMKTATEYLKTNSMFDKPTEAVVKTTAKETNKDTLDSYINSDCSQSSDKLFKENTFWHLNHILPHDHNLDKRIYENSYYANTKREISYKKSDSDTLISYIGTTSENDEIKNTDLEKIDFKSTQSKYKEADTIRHKVKRDLGSNFPMLGLLEQVNDGKRIKALKSYLKLLLEFAGNSEEENTSQSFKREFYEEQDELEPLNTKF